MNEIEPEQVDLITPWSNRERFVFVSHASADSHRAAEVAEYLENAGHRVWLDTADLPSFLVHESAGSYVREALASVTDFVAILTDKSVARPWVRHEWEQAANRYLLTGSPTLYAIDANCESVPELPWTLLVPDGVKALDQLAVAIGRLGTRKIASADLTEMVNEIRANWLVGASSAVRAIHLFESVHRTIRERIDAAVESGFSSRGPEGMWLRMLGPILDLRCSSDWLIPVAIAAARTDPTLSELDRSILVGNAAVVAIFGGWFRQADDLLAEAIERSAYIDDQEGVLVAHGNLVLAALERGDPDAAATAIDALPESIRPGSVGSLAHEALLANHRGRIEMARGNLSGAHERFSQHLKIAVAEGLPRQIGAALGWAAYADISAGRFGLLQKQMLDRYRRISISTLNPRGAANADHWVAHGERMVGAVDSAAERFRAELALRELLNEPHRQALTLRLLGGDGDLASQLEGAAKYRSDCPLPSHSRDTP